MRRIPDLIIALSVCVAVQCPNDCAAQMKTDEEIISEIKEHPYRAGANTCPYYPPSVRYTSAPKGYKAFYVSHIGRHGSRYQTNGGNVYDKPLALLDSLYAVGELTSQGDSLRMELHTLRQAHSGMDGMLTRKGSAEHTAIAGRLAARCPSVFHQKDRPVVYCTATTVQRTIQSMAGFIAGLGSACNSNLSFSIGCGFKIEDYLKPEEKNVDKKLVNSQLDAMQKVLSPDITELEGLQRRFFKGYKASGIVLFSIFKASSAAGCLDVDVDPLRFFTPEELFAFYKRCDIVPCIKYGPFGTTRTETAKSGKKYLRLIISDADRAIDGNGHCADLRFAHDANIGPVMDLLVIGGYSVEVKSDAPYRYWQSYNQLSMGSNLQLEFYKNAKSDILVKALFNEREVTFPGLVSVNGIFYRWPDVRNYILDKCD